MIPADLGLEVIDNERDAAFAARPLHVRDVVAQMEGMQRIARAFVEKPEMVLQELVDAAVGFAGRTARASVSRKRIAPTKSFTTGSRRRVSTPAF